MCWRRCFGRSAIARATSCASGASRSRSSRGTSAASSLSGPRRWRTTTASTRAPSSTSFARSIPAPARCRRRRSPTQPEQPGIFALLTRPSRTPRARPSARSGRARRTSSRATQRPTGSRASSASSRAHSAARPPLRGGACACSTSPRVPLFVPRLTAGTPVAHVALLSPPSVLLAGDVREETTELRFALGRGMAAAMPHNVLRLGLPPAEARLGHRGDARGVRPAGDGPPRRRARGATRRVVLADHARARTAAPAGAARDPGGRAREYEDLVARAHQSGRRVGLFLAGDFACAVRVLLVRVARRAPTTSRRRSPRSASCARACLRWPICCALAVSPEYAEARWHVVAPAAPRGMMSSGRFSLF